MNTLKLATVSEDQVWFGVLVDTEDRLVASAFDTTRTGVDAHLTRLARKLAGSEPIPVGHPFAHDMVELFNGRNLAVDVPLSNGAVTAFQEKVYGILRKIPKGRVTTYGMIAKTVASGPRAVGTAVASNPWTLFVPCHRVVPSGLTVGNYSMNESITQESCVTKRELLRREGVLFQQDKILPPSLWNPREA